MKKQFSHTGLREVVVDHMPIEVAREFLITPAVRMTNRLRKNCLAARHKVFVPTAERKPITDRLARRFQSKSIAWVSHELGRCIRQRRGVQRKYEAALRLPPNPVLRRFVALLDLKAAHLDATRDVLGDELAWRYRLAHGKIAPAIFLGDSAMRRLFIWTGHVPGAGSICWTQTTMDPAIDAPVVNRVTGVIS